jgi:hypothetical protein
MTNAQPGPSTPQTTGDYRRPDIGPSAEDLQQRERWNAYVESSLDTATASAEKWRTGLGAFVTLVTTGLLIKGPEAASDLRTGWRIALTVLLGGGLALAVMGLWLALMAAAGSARPRSLEQLMSEFGSIDLMKVALARKAVRFLRGARGLVAVALVMLGAGLITWWWAPKAAPSPAAYVKVSTEKGDYCGVLTSADESTFVLAVAGVKAPQQVPFAKATNIRIVASC